MRSGRQGLIRRTTLLWALVAAGPASAAIAGVLLVANRALFRHGPDVPVAGRPEGWTVIWLVLGLVLLGHAVSVPTSLGWYLAVLRRGRRPGPLLTLASGYATAIAAALAWVFFWPH